MDIRAICYTYTSPLPPISMLILWAFQISSGNTEWKEGRISDLPLGIELKSSIPQTVVCIDNTFCQESSSNYIWRGARNSLRELPLELFWPKRYKNVNMVPCYAWGWVAEVEFEVFKREFLESFEKALTRIRVDKNCKRFWEKAEE